MKNIDYEVSDIATIGIIIFNRNYRCIGLGKILVWASTYLFYSCEDIEWFGAGMEKENIPSYKSFRACGYKKIKSDQKENYVVLNKLDLKKPEFINNVILQNY